MMPIITFIGDDEGQLEEIILATADHGGQCVLAGGLTMSGIQAKRTLAAAKLFDSGLESSFRELYSWEPKRKPKYSSPRGYTTCMMRLVRELCIKHGLKDRMPRYIAQGPLAINKRIAERLFINLQNPKNSYPRSKLRRISEFFPTGRVLLKHGTHVASYGEFVSLKILRGD